MHEYGTRDTGARAELDFDERVPATDDEPGPAYDTVTVGDTGHDVVLRGDRFVVGRLSACDICVEDANVSRRHAEFIRIDDAWYVQDLESTNGTKLNGRPVDRARLSDGDVIELGVTRLTYHHSGE